MSDLTFALTLAARCLAAAEIDYAEAVKELESFEQNIASGKYSKVSAHALKARHHELTVAACRATFLLAQRREQYKQARVEVDREREIDLWIEYLSQRLRSEVSYVHA